MRPSAGVANPERRGIRARVRKDDSEVARVHAATIGGLDSNAGVAVLVGALNKSNDAGEQ